MFIGEYQHTIDDKGRFIMPAKFREALGDWLMITKGLDGCLFVYTRNEWSVLEEKLKKLPFTNSHARAFARYIFGGAVEYELDKQGRVLLTTHLREYANISKEIVLVGVGTRVEIWNKESWNIYSRKAEESYEELAEKMVELDLGF
ncbi:MAG: division/cell wall cluster transcriptional repressor MraZ [Clostridia bacterium]|nr:division/cell wall cluster transcriptional repressor MraZ [Clostridia bacterium]MDD4047259.1 division/cell wall cluster transcriptional repressor MraZ [Clostridia bacterium]